MEATGTGYIQGGGYFTNLMNEGGNELLGSHPTSSPEVELSQNGGSNPRRGGNFEKNEDELLVSAWLNVSMDPVQGNNQKRDTYWNRIHEYFHSNKGFPSSRNANSLMHRWGVIQENVNKFVGCLAQIEARNASGTTIQQRLVDAQALWESREKKVFKFLHCWNILRTAPKWTLEQQSKAQKSNHKKQKATKGASPGLSASINLDDQDVAPQEVASQDADIPKRPMGKKRAKETLRKGGDHAYNEALAAFWAKKHESDAEKERKKDERYKEAFAIEQERLALKKKEFEFNRTKEEDKIMSLDISALPLEKQQYFKTRQDEIIARRCMAQGE